MAIYHFSMQGISRGQGRSTTAAAAYRSGERIVDARTGEVFDYTRRAGVLETAVFLPDGGTMEREALWNLAEGAEKRKDAKVAREIVVALPHELSREQQWEAVCTYAQGLSAREGWAVDVAMHAPGRAGDQRNTHAHLLCTTRIVQRDEAGCPVMGSKTKEWDHLAHGPKKVASERAEWEAVQNQYLEHAQVESRVDCRSYEAQGVDLQATQHLGVHAMAMERRGIETERGDHNRAVQQHNAQVIELAQVREQKAQETAWHRELERMDGLPIEEHRKAVAALCPSRLETLIENHPEVKAAEAVLQSHRKDMAQWSAAMAQQHEEANRVLSDYDYQARFHPRQLKAVEQGLWLNPTISGILSRQDKLNGWFSEHLGPYQARLTELEKREASVQSLKASLEPWAKERQEKQFHRFDEAQSRLLKSEWRESEIALERLKQLPYEEMRKEVEALRLVLDADTLKLSHPFVRQIPSAPDPYHSDEQQRVWDAQGAVRLARHERDEWVKQHPVQHLLHETGVKVAPGLKLREAQTEYLEIEERRAKPALGKVARQDKERSSELRTAGRLALPPAMSQQSSREYLYTSAKEVLERRTQREPEQAQQWEQAKRQERGRGGRGWSR